MPKPLALCARRCQRKIFTKKRRVNRKNRDQEGMVMAGDKKKREVWVARKFGCRKLRSVGLSDNNDNGVSMTS